MRQRRAKSYRKQMLVYNHTFKFREPYQAIVDDQLVLDCCQSKFDILKGLKRTLQAEVKVMITQCCMQALYKTDNQEAISIAKEFERRRCNHPPKDPKSPLECIESIVDIKGSNKHRYVVASQDMDIRRKLRKIPGVPIVHVSRAVMILEPLSDASLKISERLEKDKLYKGLNDSKHTAGLDEPKSEKSEKTSESKKNKGPKQPNPLSMKKRKSKPASNEVEAETESKKKRRRKHRSNANSNESEIKHSDNENASDGE
ncbi:hypothetical protein Kpol_1045p74 [Vanderwaltozyma polyspora DSM 70294]|uniref:U three protein 23 n=1 Tax=Vanderwaltozyma polyspora (strain ATCC 22028 / DSM 70294 / BCRC 21397 / CBS 2163 / NBRC 10782 / NRRL Y-8283 / UCD 57-17) TaxID=436907 RepID=A7TI80_VANPO|nr:uncharacterized protein Kpol_1045p74 [Vanderwaltozyma polyspora DSM 70294]EDO18087.1 hypothetical protein Kpol_1045p74 [Vanderwaltozyma polyspora DSM 70294]